MIRRFRKAALGISAAVIILSAGTVAIAAAAPGYGSRYVDSNGDGVCDYTGSSCRNFTDSDGDGICDNRAERQGRGFCGGRRR